MEQPPIAVTVMLQVAAIAGVLLLGAGVSYVARFPSTMVCDPLSRF